MILGLLLQCPKLKHWQRQTAFTSTDQCVLWHQARFSKSNKPLEYVGKQENLEYTDSNDVLEEYVADTSVLLCHPPRCTMALSSSHWDKPGVTHRAGDPSSASFHTQTFMSIRPSTKSELMCPSRPVVTPSCSGCQIQANLCSSSVLQECFWTPTGPNDTLQCHCS